MASWTMEGGRPYVPVAERRRKAEREMAKLRKKGHPVSPVRIEGRTIATTFWGKAWCENLESYRDYENRLPRGRTYVRNGSVVDLQIAPREVTAMVSGSAIYKVKISIEAVPKAAVAVVCAGIARAGSTRWSSCCRAAFQGRDGAALPAGQWPVSQTVGNPVLLQLPGLTRRCASMSRPCCMASARASTSSRSFCFACARWTRTSWWPIWTRLCPCRRRHRPPGEFLKPMMSPRCSVSTWRRRRVPFSRVARRRRN